MVTILIIIISVASAIDLYDIFFTIHYDVWSVEVGTEAAINLVMMFFVFCFFDYFICLQQQQAAETS